MVVSPSDFSRLMASIGSAATLPDVDDDDGLNACACGWKRSPYPDWGVWHSTFKMWKPDGICGPVEG